jgi:hypothetical protein
MEGHPGSVDGRPWIWRGSGSGCGESTDSISRVAARVVAQMS